MSHIDTAYKLGAYQAQHDFQVELSKLAAPTIMPGAGAAAAPAPAAPAAAMGRSQGTGVTGPTAGASVPRSPAPGTTLGSGGLGTRGGGPTAAQNAGSLTSMMAGRMGMGRGPM